MTEIERKFLVKSDNFKEQSSKKISIIQAYLNTHPERTIRIRINDNDAYLTIKGKSSEDGLTRFEWEKKIPMEEARKLLKICEPGKIEKYRHHVNAGKHTYEVDEFLGENHGLVIAELELEEEEDKFEKPEWLGEEVTGNLDYYNSNLIANPYKNWKK